MDVDPNVNPSLVRALLVKESLGTLLYYIFLAVACFEKLLKLWTLSFLSWSLYSINTKWSLKDDIWSVMTLNYWMMVEGYPNLKEEVAGSIPGCEISSLLDRYLVLACRPSVSIFFLKIKNRTTTPCNEESIQRMMKLSQANLWGSPLYSRGISIFNSDSSLLPHKFCHVSSTHWLSPHLNLKETSILESIKIKLDVVVPWQTTDV